MKAPKQEEFSFKTKAERDKIEYLALEGGGGKGNVFFGAIQALELIGKLPLNPENKTNRGKNFTIKGIAGASAGSITAYLLTLGCTSEQIKEVMTKYNFNDFFEVPIKGVYKCVTKENGKNVFKIATDNLSKEKKEVLTNKGGNFFDPITGRKILIKSNALRVTHGGNTFNNLTDAIQSGKKNHRRYKRLFYSKHWVFSKIIGWIVNNSIYEFLFGSVRTGVNKDILKFLIDKTNSGAIEDVKKAWEKFVSNASKVWSPFKKALVFTGNIFSSQLFY